MHGENERVAETMEKLLSGNRVSMSADCRKAALLTAYRFLDRTDFCSFGKAARQLLLLDLEPNEAATRRAVQNSIQFLKGSGECIQDSEAAWSTEVEEEITCTRLKDLFAGTPTNDRKFSDHLGRWLCELKDPVDVDRLRAKLKSDVEPWPEAIEAQFIGFKKALTTPALELPPGTDWLNSPTRRAALIQAYSDECHLTPASTGLLTGRLIRMGSDPQGLNGCRGGWVNAVCSLLQALANEPPGQAGRMLPAVIRWDLIAVLIEQLGHAELNRADNALILEAVAKARHDPSSDRPSQIAIGLIQVIEHLPNQLPSEEPGQRQAIAVLDALTTDLKADQLIPVLDTLLDHLGRWGFPSPAGKTAPLQTQHALAPITRQLRRAHEVTDAGLALVADRLLQCLGRASPDPHSVEELLRIGRRVFERVPFPGIGTDATWRALRDTLRAVSHGFPHREDVQEDKRLFDLAIGVNAPRGLLAGLLTTEGQKADLKPFMRESGLAVASFVFRWLSCQRTEFSTDEIDVGEKFVFEALQAAASLPSHSERQVLRALDLCRSGPPRELQLGLATILENGLHATSHRLLAANMREFVKALPHMSGANAQKFSELVQAGSNDEKKNLAAQAFEHLPSVEAGNSQLFAVFHGFLSQMPKHIRRTAMKLAGDAFDEATPAGKETVFGFLEQTADDGLFVPMAGLLLRKIWDPSDPTRRFDDLTMRNFSRAVRPKISGLGGRASELIKTALIDAPPDVPPALMRSFISLAPHLDIEALCTLFDAWSSGLTHPLAFNDDNYILGIQAWIDAYEKLASRARREAIQGDDPDSTRTQRSSGTARHWLGKAGARQHPALALARQQAGSEPLAPSGAHLSAITIASFFQLASTLHPHLELPTVEKARPLPDGDRAKTAVRLALPSIKFSGAPISRE